MAARAISSGTISFGLVSIPVKLYTAASPQQVSFNMIHAKCGGRMKQQMFCPVDNEVVDRKDMVRGFEHARDQYVTFTEEELKKLESPRTNDLELVEFVPESTVDFVYIEKTYYLGPDKGGERAYRLLSEAMQRMKKIAVGRYWTRGREQLVLVRPYKKGLALHQVFYENEVRAFDDIETGGDFAFKDVEKDLADKLIEQLDQPQFDPKKFRDEYQYRVTEAINQKVAGQEIVSAAEPPKAQIIDLLEALKRSVADASQAKKAAANETEASEAAEEKAAATAAKGPKKAEPKPSPASKKKSAG
jgi:DNA end-binding protein Ku